MKKVFLSSPQALSRYSRLMLSSILSSLVLLRVLKVLLTGMLAALLVLHAAQARVEIREFATPEQEATYNKLIQVLRCPKCQNQNIADSDAPLAQDLREKVYTQLNEGLSELEIRNYMKARYGDFISYKPPLKWETAALWILPWGLVGVIGFLIWRRTKQTGTQQQELSDSEADKVANILKNHGSETKQSESAK